MNPFSLRDCLRRLALAMVLTCACAPEPAPAAEGFALAITDAKGAAVSDFVAVFDFGRAHPVRVACPAGNPSEPDLRCAEPGIVSSRAYPSFTVTVKARPYAFANLTIETAALPVRDQHPTAPVKLVPLSPFERTDSYATGFDAKGGLERFRRFAYAQNTEMGPTEVVKFYIDDLAGTPKVYFQNTRKTPVHYEFVTKVLGKPLSLEAFEAETYRGEDRKAMAGSVVLYSSVEADSVALGTAAHAPLCVTFFPSDDLTPAQARRAQLLIEEALGFAALSGGEHRVVYLPAGEQQEADLDDNLRLFEASDSAWMRATELFGSTTLQILNEGIAYGTLRVLTPEQLASEVVSYQDILVLTRLPNLLPIVGGTITEERQTPLAHVNVAARTRGTPNISLKAASTNPQIEKLAGKLVRFEVAKGRYTLTPATRADAEKHWRKRSPEPLVPSYDLSVKGLPGFEEIGFADSLSVGVKAANLAELGKVLGDEAPFGFAVPFFYFDEHMRRSLVTNELCEAARTDCTEEGRATELCEAAHTLCAAGVVDGDNLMVYLDRLLTDADFPVDTPLREACLDGLQYLIRNSPVEPTFGEALDARVAEVFGSAKVKLRSSTNAEDLPGFSGAGLYESQSAYAQGDKAASLRIGDVYASVFAFRAFEERTYWNIEHRAVRMGVAVDTAILDEQVNGVLITQNIADTSVAGMYVNLQQGESPVTNPEDGSLPEILTLLPSPSGGSVQAQYLRYSSLSPDAHLLSEAEIEALYDAAWKVQLHFAKLYAQSEYSLALDLELKFHGPKRHLLIKQARPYTALAK